MGKYADYGRELHTLPHRDNLDTNDSLLFYQNGEYKQLELNKIQALQAGIELNVTAPEGSVISVSGEDMETFSKTGGTVQFSLAGMGTYTVSATKDGRTASETLVVDSIRVYNVTLEYYHLYGISRDTASSSPEWTRTDEAVGFEAVASVGNTTVGHSDFDDCYPWSDMKRITFPNNDVMVWIPEFWYKREVDSSGIETIQICNMEITGFVKHPGSGRYISAHLVGPQGGGETGSWNSIAGINPSYYWRTYLCEGYINSSKGAGWHNADFATWSAIQMLYIVEFATNNSQEVIGSGLSSNCTQTGLCDYLTYKTGKDSTSNQIIYRGIEQPWGYNRQQLVGLFANSRTYYVCLDRTKYAQTSNDGYTALSYSAPSNGFTLNLGYDSNFPWAMLPSASGGSSTTGYCDENYFMFSGQCTLCVGGGSPTTSYNGMFYGAAVPYDNIETINMGRTIYVPEDDPTNISQDPQRTVE